MTNEQQVDFVLRTIEERDVRFVRLWFSDVLGNLKSFAVSPEDLEEAFEEGIGFDGYSVDGFAPLEESDMLAFPDPATFQVLPWRPEERGAARMFCTIVTPSNEPFVGDARSLLKRLFARYEEQGYVFAAGPELEFFYFDNDTAPVPLDHAGYFDHTPDDFSRDLRRNTTLMLEKMSIPVEYSYHSNGPSQNAISLRYAEAVTTADNILTARHVIKQEAHSNGLYASFMPKPLSECSGSGMFMFESVFDREGNNVFWGEGEPGSTHLSDFAKHFIAGLLKYAPEFALVTNPNVNSYKRLVPNGEVPVYTTWGRRNRSVLVRVPMHKPGKSSSARLELRLADPSCNPYLMLAITFAAGMRGVEEGLPLQEETTTDVFKMTPAEREAAGIRRLPRDLGEAIKLFGESAFVHEILGDHICDYLVAVKQHEWDSYCSTVTDWEREHYYAGY